MNKTTDYAEIEGIAHYFIGSKLEDHEHIGYWVDDPKTALKLFNSMKLKRLNPYVNRKIVYSNPEIGFLKDAYENLPIERLEEIVQTDEQLPLVKILDELTQKLCSN